MYVRNCSSASLSDARSLLSSQLEGEWVLASLPQSIGGNPNAGNSVAPKVVISGIAPSWVRKTSNLKARNRVSPGRRKVAGGCRHPVGCRGQ